MERRGILKAFLATLAAAWGAQRAAPDDRLHAAQAGVALTKHIRLYVEMDIAPAREREMLDLFTTSSCRRPSSTTAISA